MKYNTFQKDFWSITNNNNSTDNVEKIKKIL